MKNYEQELMLAIAPFVEDYKLHPYGFAETDNLNDIDECQKDVDKIMWVFNHSDMSDKKNIIKKEIDRWCDGRNAGCFGRFIGRLEYLKLKK